MHPLRALLFIGSASLSLVACGDKAGGGGLDSGLEKPYCYDLADADGYELREGGGDPGSGQLQARLITGESGSDDIRDPQIVGQMDYTLENLDVGGSPQAGKSDQDGAFAEEVGAGNWRISISGTKSGMTCQNQVDVLVEDGNTTLACIATLCE